MGKTITTLLLLIAQLSWAQNNSCKLEGRITDKEGNAIPYSNIYIPALQQGTMANIDGEYALNLKCGSYEILIQSMGYQSKSLKIDLSQSKSLNIELQVATYNLNEVVVDPNSEDPAYNVIRKAIAMAEYYKKQITAYKAKLYVRQFYRIDEMPWLFEKMMEEEDLKDAKTGDVTEMLVEYAYERPNKVEETILAKKSGSRDTFQMGSSFINLNFYDIGDDEIISPLERGSFAVYKFEYQSSSFEEGQKIHEIKVIPRRKGGDLMSGTIYVNDKLWNINKVDITFEQSLGTIDYIQIYHEVEPLVWMPTNHKIKANIKIIGVDAKVQYLATLKDLEVSTDASIDEQIKRQLELTKTIYDTTQIGIEQKKSNSSKPILSKREEKIEELLSKEKLNNREAFKLARLIKKESQEQQPDTINTLEVTSEYKVNYADSAFNYSDSSWNEMREVPLSKTEEVIYEKREEIIANKKPDTSKTVNEEGLLTKILFNNSYVYNKSKRFGFLPKGLLTGLDANFNTVDGWLVDKDIFTLKYSNLKGSSFYLTPVASYAFARDAFMPSVKFVGNYWAKQRGTFYGAVGRRSSDFNGDFALSKFANTALTTFFTVNFPKFYLEDFVSFTNEIDLRNGLRLTSGFHYADRSSLQNNSSQKPFNFLDREYSSNIPEHIEVVNNPGIIQDHTAFNIEAGLAYTPQHRYRMRGYRKVMLDSKYPTFSLNYKKGIPDAFQGNTNFDLVSFNITQSLPFRLIDRIDYQVEVGKFLNNNSLFFADFRDFNTNPGFYAFNNAFNSFKLLDYYNFNSSEEYFKSHFSIQNNHLLLKYLPLLNKTNWSERLEFSYLINEQNIPYYEFGYSMSKMFLFLDAGVFVNFIDHDFKIMGIQLGIDLNEL